MGPPSTIITEPLPVSSTCLGGDGHEQDLGISAAREVNERPEDLALVLFVFFSADRQQLFRAH
jgi:hypothetical protein